MKISKRDFLILSLSGLIALSCIQRYDGYENVPEMRQKTASVLTEVNLETLPLDSVYCSGEGFTGVVKNDRIYYLDRYFTWLYAFDRDGHLIERTMGIGRGPKESVIKHSMSCAFTDSGEIALSGTSLDFEWFSGEGKLLNRFLLPSNRRSSNPEEYCTYTTPDEVVSRLYDGKLYTAMSSDNPEFAYIMDADKYIRNARHVSEVDLERRVPTGMYVTGYPSIYHDDPYRYTSFESVDFDMDNQGNVYVGFPVDSLIYVFDRHWKPKFSFGRPGTGIDADYEYVRSVNDVEKYRRNLATKGRYSWIEYIDATKVCCRSYKKGSHSEYDGLQIYREGQLVADVNVPKDMKVVGYIAPYYYSQVYSSEELGQLTVYRFKL